MPRLTKPQVRKRLSEAGDKLARVYVQGSTHFTQGQMKKIVDMRLAISKIVNDMK